MNVRVFDQLTKWAEGKSPIVGITAPLAAFVADPIYRLMATSEGRALQDLIAARDPVAFRRYYEDPSSLLAELPLDQLPVGWRITSEDIECWREMAAGSPKLTWSELKAPQDPEFFSYCSKEYQKLQRELYGMLASDIEGEVSDEAMSVWRTGSIAYLLRVAVPFVVRYRTSPQLAYARATGEAASPLKELGDLLDCDPELIRDERIAPVLFAGGREEIARRWEVSAARISNPSQPMTRNEVLISLASLASLIATWTDGRFDGRDVRLLCNLAEQARTGDECRLERGLPARPDTLRKALERGRGQWRAWLDPDNSLGERVRVVSRWLTDDSQHGRAA